VNCRGCELWKPATQVVFSAGNPKAPLALVGEQPGDVEDRKGIPFVGPAGQLLQDALREAEIPTNDVYITNAVKHFRFTERGKRRIHATPQVTHIKACRPWLEAELTLVDPELIVCLGAVAAKSLLGTTFRVTQQRGQVLELATPIGVRRVLATVHPSAVLRAAGDDRSAAFAGLVADLRTAMTAVA
jgi:uracil-DNA glycosylase